jgi:hypothetical protein
MKPVLHTSLFIVFLLKFSVSYAQKDSFFCKVKMPELDGSYLGGCKLGLADGEGTARGNHVYTGEFKNGLPNGTGNYYYSDSQYYSGSFQDGLKEGKGEMHYARKPKPDSVIKGYWSGDIYRGKKYTTYSFTTTEVFDQTEISPSSSSGNTVSVEIGTTSGSPSGSRAGYVLTLMNMVSPSGCILKTESSYDSDFKSYRKFELASFPCKLFGTLSDGRTFEIELYKAANWKLRFYQNR